MIPLVDLEAQYNSIKTEVNTKIDEVINSREFIQGKFVTEFESAFSKLHQVNNVVGCSNGTAAISIALQALGLQPGDEVITTPHTFIATTEAIIHIGAKPVFVDINPKTYNIDPSKIEIAINKHTKAILPVHLYGNPVEIDKIADIAKEHHLFLIEDCAQAHLATYNNVPVGTYGDIATFSFYPGKNLGAYGDAGAIITNSAELSAKCRMLIDHGRKDKYTHQVIGYNQRMDGIQAGILTVKSKYIANWTKKRQQNANIYNRLLSNNANIVIPHISDKAKPVFHLYVIQAKRRDDLQEYLKDNGISCGVHYPIPLHLQPALKYLGYKAGDFPITEEVSKNIISLPMYPELTEDQIITVCNTIDKFYLQNT